MSVMSIMNCNLNKIICFSLFFYDILTSNDILYRIMPSVMFSTDQSTRSLSNLEVSKLMISAPINKAFFQYFCLFVDFSIFKCRLLYNMFTSTLCVIFEFYLSKQKLRVLHCVCKSAFCYICTDIVTFLAKPSTR